ncbi:hypothetical protein POM88_041978 [Heracleum sosnowskyi]|uniref:Uncharacterized protein n=1 Tax=Heracleum sosnowskyi TaxID=360622 RepID=A0AAD8HHV8_9APIA|nr:hypothetical protein POM88_041978 [Heracleum sosnowskyi]
MSFIFNEEFSHLKSAGHKKVPFMVAYWNVENLGHVVILSELMQFSSTIGWLKCACIGKNVTDLHQTNIHSTKSMPQGTLVSASVMFGFTLYSLQPSYSRVVLQVSRIVFKFDAAHIAHPRGSAEGNLFRTIYLEARVVASFVVYIMEETFVSFCGSRMIFDRGYYATNKTGPVAFVQSGKSIQ